MIITLMSEVETAIAEQARRLGTTPERLVSESLQVWRARHQPSFHINFL